MSKKLLYYGSTTSFQNLYYNNLGGSDEFVDYGDNDAFTFGDGAGTDQVFTFSLLLNKTSGTSGTLFAKTSIGVGTFEYSFFIFGSQLYCRLYSQLNGTIFIGRRSTITIGNGVWARYTWTYSASKTNAGNKLYENATQIDTTNVSAGSYVSMQNGASNLRLGVLDNASSLPLTGKVAHPVLFKRNLSAAEVTELTAIGMGDYRTLSFYNPSELVFCNRYPNGTSDYPITEDYSGNGHDGTMTNQESTDIILYP